MKELEKKLEQLSAKVFFEQKECEQDSNDWYYLDGYLDTIDHIMDIIKADNGTQV